MPPVRKDPTFDATKVVTDATKSVVDTARSMYESFQGMRAKGTKLWEESKKEGGR